MKSCARVGTKDHSDAKGVHVYLNDSCDDELGGHNLFTVRCDSEIIQRCEVSMIIFYVYLMLDLLFLEPNHADRTCATRIQGVAGPTNFRSQNTVPSIPFINT